MDNKIEWEIIYVDKGTCGAKTSRAKFGDGYLVKNETWDNEGSNPSLSESMVFVPFENEEVRKQLEEMVKSERKKLTMMSKNNVR